MSGPQRIVSLISSATEMLFALGLGERVVGVSHECDWPPEATAIERLTRSEIDSRRSSEVIDQQVRDTLDSGTALYRVDERRLVELAPQLVVTQAQCDVCAVSHDEVLRIVGRHEALRDTVVVSLQPLSLEDVFGDIRRLGELTACSAAAEQYLVHLTDRVEVVREKTAGLSLPQRPRVAVIEWTDPLMAAGNWTAELVELAGGRYGVGRRGGHSRHAPWEAFRAFDPEVLVVSPCGFALRRSRFEASGLCQLPGWADVAAVRSGRAYVVDGSAYLNRPGPRLVDSLEILAHLIHPKRFDPPPLAPAAGPAWCRIGRQE